MNKSSPQAQEKKKQAKSGGEVGPATGSVLVLCMSQRLLEPGVVPAAPLLTPSSAALPGTPASKAGPRREAEILHQQAALSHTSSTMGC